MYWYWYCSPPTPPPPLLCRLFGGLILDIKRKAPFYLSDYKDGLSLQCVASFLFLYCACMSPVITFGGLLGEATEGRIVRTHTSKWWPTTTIWSCVAKFEMVFFTLDKSRDSQLQNGISYTAVEEQWESNSALKVDKLVTPLLRKWPLNILVHLL
jgi:hypothetical protein